MYMICEDNTLLETKPDSILKDFYRRKDRFADIVNAILFDGKSIVDEHCLSAYDSDSSTSYSLNKLEKSLSKNRDIIKLFSKHGSPPILIGLENQQTIDYTMPFRNMFYDINGYNQQYRLLDDNRRKSFSPIPIVTLVIYYGEDRWIRPFRFKDMMSIPEEYQQYVNDWDGHIFDIKELKVEKLKHQDNILMIGTLQKIYAWDKNIRNLENLVLPKEIAIVVETIMGNKELTIQIEKEESEEIDMCRVIDEAIREGELRGKLKGELEKEITMLMKLLKRKLGFLSSEVVVKIESATTKQLDELTISIFDIENEDDVIKILSH